MSDHFGTLCIKGLELSKNTGLVLGKASDRSSHENVLKNFCKIQRETPVPEPHF